MGSLLLVVIIMTKDNFIWVAHIERYSDSYELEAKQIPILNGKTLLSANDRNNPMYPYYDFTEDDLDKGYEIEEEEFLYYYTRDFIKARNWIIKTRKAIIANLEKTLDNIKNNVKINVTKL